ncbi:MAG: hypothetical protein ACRD2I_01135 [Vicinamibacterales bacterium]
MANKREENIERARADRHKRVVAPQPPPNRVDTERPEFEDLLLVGDCTRPFGNPRHISAVFSLFRMSVRDF